MADTRDPGQIDEALAALRTVWAESPDLRLGQLLVNAVRPPEPCPEIFYVEDDVLLEGLSRLRKQIQAARATARSDRR